MADSASAARPIDSILARWSRLDVLVTCARKSGGWPNPEREHIAIAPVEDWRHELEGNVEGTAQVVRSVLPAMKRGGWGRIVLISSGGAADGQTAWRPYAAAKAALHGLNRSLALGLVPRLGREPKHLRRRGPGYGRFVMRGIVGASGDLG